MEFSHLQCLLSNVTLQSRCPKSRGMGVNVRLPKIHKTPPEADVQSLAKSESWIKPSRQCWAVLPTWQYCRNSFVWWMYEINLVKRLSHAWVHFVTALVNLLTDHRMSSLPIRAKYKHFNTICEQTCDNSLTDSSSSCLNWWSSRQRLETLQNCSTFLFANSQYRSTHFRACPYMSWDHAMVFFCAKFLARWYFFGCSRWFFEDKFPMHPSFPNLPSPQSEYLLSKILPAIN